MKEELLEAYPCRDTSERECFEYEREHNILFTGFEFPKEDKKKWTSQFSGGEQAKIAPIRLLLKKPDILLLSEPTDHLGIETTGWLELYMKHYKNTVVMASYDRFFLDRTAGVVYELFGKVLRRYPCNYTHYREEKLKQAQLQKKAYERR